MQIWRTCCGIGLPNGRPNLRIAGEEAVLEPGLLGYFYASGTGMGICALQGDASSPHPGMLGSAVRLQDGKSAVKRVEPNKRLDTERRNRG